MNKINTTSDKERPTQSKKPHVSFHEAIRDLINLETRLSGMVNIIQGEPGAPVGDGSKSEPGEIPLGVFLSTGSERISSFHARVTDLLDKLKESLFEQ